MTVCVSVNIVCVSLMTTWLPDAPPLHINNIYLSLLSSYSSHVLHHEKITFSIHIYHQLFPNCVCFVKLLVLADQRMFLLLQVSLVPLCSEVCVVCVVCACMHVF